jgi:hypothetical protein
MFASAPIQTSPTSPPSTRVFLPKDKLSRSVAVPYKDVWGTPSGCPDSKTFITPDIITPDIITPDIK